MYFSYLVVVKGGQMKPSGFLRYQDFHGTPLGFQGSKHVIVIGSWRHFQKLRLLVSWFFHVRNVDYPVTMLLLFHKRLVDKE